MFKFKDCKIIPKLLCIYMIKNPINNKFYIGSTKNLKMRMQDHRGRLLRNVHASIILQKAINKYGIDIFEIYVLKECAEDILLDEEQFYLDFLLPQYNVSKQANRPDVEVTETRRANHTLANNRRWADDEYRTKMSALFKDMYKDEEEKKKLVAKLCKNITPEMRQASAKKLNEKNWSNPEYRNRMTGENSPNALFTREQVIEIKTLSNNGKSNKEISELLNVKRYLINNIINNKTYKNITI